MGRTASLRHSLAPTPPPPVVERIVADRQERADAPRAGVVDRRAGVARRQGDLVLVRANERRDYEFTPPREPVPMTPKQRSATT
jgi:hypothetical protein